MGFIKIGSIVRITKIGKTIDDLQLDDEQLKRLGSRIATADFVHLNPGKFIYTRERAVSAFERYGLNGNADGFLDEELKHRYASFINSPRYIDHNNSDTTQAIGIVLDSVYHPLAHPQGGWVETVSALDKEKMAQIVLHGFPNQPTMLDAVVAGKLTDVSMGCLKAGTPILLADGRSIPIEQIKKDDLVISHTGSVRGVTEINVRPHQGVCYELKAYGVRTPFTITGEHPLLLVRREQTECRPSPNKNKGHYQHVCVQGSQALKKNCARCGTIPKYHFDWVPVEDSSVGDYLAMPVPNFEAQESFTDDEVRILGYYLAEGYLLKNRLVDGTESVTGIGFSTGLNESGTHQLLCELGARVGASVSEVDYPERSGKNILFWSCPELARKCHDHCGERAKEKNLSASILGMSPEQALLFLGAYANGDGGAYKGSLYFSTSSSQLAEQIRILLLRVGMIASVNQIIHKPSTLVSQETVEYQVWIGTDTSWKLQTPDTARLQLRKSEKLSSKRFFYEYEGTVYLMAPIESIDDVPYDDLVYNFEVEGDHSYLVHGLAVHNCYVEESLCTVCGNRAMTEHDYCDHVVTHRGRRVKAASTCPVPVDKEGFVVAGELNFGVTFFELSNITSLAQYGGGGADPDAKILEKVACSGWECFIIDRFPKQLAVRPTGANGSYCGCTEARANIRPVNQEGNMGDIRKRGVEVAPVAPADAQSVTDRIKPATDPGDEDKALFDQSKGKSDGGNAAVTTDPDRISQEKKPPDYPLTAQNKRAVGVEADPANRLGGTPEPVAEEEEKVRKDKFKGVKEELGDKGPEVEEKMEKELDEEKPLSNALGALFTNRFPTIASSERFKEIQDELDTLEIRRGSVLAALKRTRSEKRKMSLKQALKEINAGILKYFGQFAGNPQDMDDTFKSNYDGGADKKLYNQAKPGSEGGPSQTVAVPDGITQEKDPKDYPLKGARKVIASTEADKAAKEMLDLCWHQGKSFEEAQQIIFDRYGRDIAQASKSGKCEDGKGYDSKAQQGFMHAKKPEIAQEMDKTTKNFEDLPEKSSAKDGEEPAETLDELKDKAEKNKDKEARRSVKAEGDAPEVDKVDGKSDISQPMGDHVEEIDKGNTTTLVSPDTKKVAPSSELIQAHLSRPRAALYQQVIGAGSAETELKKGNEDTLASPDTKEKADAESKIQEKRTKNLSQGVSVPATPTAISGSLGLALATLNHAQKEVIALRQQNVRLAKRLTAVKASWKWEEVKKVAFTMLKKGFFLEDPKTGSQRNWLQQKDAMIGEAKNMMRKPNEEIEGIKTLVARAPMPGRPVKEWTKRIAMPREGTVKSAIAARSAANPDEVTLETMFD